MGFDIVEYRTMTDQHQPWVDGCTIGQVLRTTADRFSARDAVVFPQAALRYSFAEFDARVDDVARGCGHAWLLQQSRTNREHD